MVNKAGWPNGKALDYESRDCRFDPCVGHFFFLFFFFKTHIHIYSAIPYIDILMVSTKTHIYTKHSYYIPPPPPSAA